MKTKISKETSLFKLMGTLIQENFFHITMIYGGLDEILYQGADQTCVFMT